MARRLDWRGAQIKDRVITAARQGIDETMAAAVEDAKSNVPVVTAILQGSIRFEPAKVKGQNIEGQWGSFDVNYALAVETGNRSLAGPGFFGPKPTGKRRPKNTGNRNFLRNAADTEYPKLAGRIKKRYG